MEFGDTSGFRGKFYIIFNFARFDLLHKEQMWRQIQRQDHGQRMRFKRMANVKE